KSEQGRIHCLDRTSVIDETFELDYLRNKVQVDRDSIRTNNRLDLQCNSGVTGFEIRRGRRPDNRQRDCRRSRTAAATALNVRNLRLGELSWVTKFPDNFDHRALAALGGDLRRGKMIDPFLLIQCPNDNLELRIGEDTRQAK